MKYLYVLIIIFFSTSLFAYNNTFTKPFKNGSPACTSCHSIKAAGFSGKTWGPDLSTLYIDFDSDADSIKSFIKDSGIPPMDAVYKGRNLSDEELNNLIKAFASLGSKNVESNNLFFTLFVIFFVGIFVAIKIFFRKNEILEANK
ncbi:conserved hypothetical protein [Deferribacter desulfuricans SSM1]|uniref:Cytochrome c domain-containing protein n=1 Tax=Deferribacter desulfuricans (strain DSM 14783 / JCM 11476 / NBRC 101012 / SSM1) TaxID=639282 RepID=D3P9Z8_DEFDS|nr:cytochrome c [Deferribacter desulfuricans]BAI81538.1 conserved hypothetical protein [Deferribacter desulfuricans SSM1]